MSGRERHPFRTDNFAAQMRWAEIPPTPELEKSMINTVNSYLRCYRLGECSVIVTREYGNWHMSISHRKRYPTWDEIAQARYRAIPKHVWMAMMLPPPEYYVNLNPNCFQLVEVDEPSHL